MNVYFTKSNDLKIIKKVIISIKKKSSNCPIPGFALLNNNLRSPLEIMVSVI